MNLARIMAELAKERPLFHSEADFQHSLGWMIREMYPDARVFAEVKSFYPTRSVSGRTRRCSLDLLVEHSKRKIAIELKYKTAEVRSLKVQGHDFFIPREGAQDTIRYDFLSDLMRLENQALAKSDTVGYAVLLTNDSLYWTPPDHQTKDWQFRLHPSRKEVSGRMMWRKDTAASTRKGRETPIDLRKPYRLKWIPYSQIKSMKSSEFRYLMMTTP